MSCGAELHIADDYGDNHATMTCQLELGHEELKHREEFKMLLRPPGAHRVVVEWEGDDRQKEG